MDAACVIDAIDHGHFEGAALLPHVLEEIARNTEALHRISKLRYIDWVGGKILCHLHRALCLKKVKAPLPSKLAISFPLERKQY